VSFVTRDSKGRLKGIRSTQPGKRGATPGFIENASNALNNAEQHASKGGYSGAIRESQNCPEQSIKALLTILELEVRWEHDVSEKLKPILGRLNTQFPQEEYASFQNRLTRVGVLSKTLASVRSYSNYGDESIGVAADVLFSGEFGRSFSELVLEELDIIYRCVTEIIEKLMQRDRPSP